MPAPEVDVEAPPGAAEAEQGESEGGKTGLEREQCYQDREMKVRFPHEERRRERVRFEESAAAPASATGAVEMGCAPTKREEGARARGRVRGERGQSKDNEKKGKQPVDGTQGPLKKKSTPTAGRQRA